MAYVIKLILSHWYCQVNEVVANCNWWKLCLHNFPSINLGKELIKLEQYNYLTLKYAYIKK